MASVLKAFLLAALISAIPFWAQAANETMTERALGKPNAPVKIDEFGSMTCSHCALFFTKILPEIEKRYIDTGKVRLVLHEFPLNGLSLKASAVARCMPKDQYIPFIKTLYGALLDNTFGGDDSETKLYQYAALGGLQSDKAKACANDAKIQEALVAERTEAAAKYNIQGTPTFVFNDGVEIINGAASVEAFAAVIDRMLAAKK